MKRLVWIATAVLVGTAAVWAASQLSSAHAELASLFPDDGLLYLQSKDFSGLLKDWNNSEEKRVWLEGEDYQAFSRSRLFIRLSQAQDEFSTAAALPANSNLLSSVAGGQSALALYDIGNLEFVYVTRMDQAHVDATPLWQVREKFEQRSEGAATFYVHQDTQSNRTAAFATRDGWLILGTRADLVAGVLDRIEGAHAHSLSDEVWYADSLKQATGAVEDLRMVLNLEKIVPSPYFRSYWVQRNSTEMKQYRAALSDLHRAQASYREERVLLRKAGLPAPASGNIEALLTLAPEDAVFASAQAAPGTERILAEMRENLLDLKPAQAESPWLAPAAMGVDHAGGASSLEERIDVAPILTVQTDRYLPLRTLLTAAQPTGMLQVYSTKVSDGDTFVKIGRGLILQSSGEWDEATAQGALTAALRPGLTASRLGLQWVKRTSGNGDIFVLDGQVPMFAAVRSHLLFVTDEESLLQDMLGRSKTSRQQREEGVTYAAVFLHSQREQQVFRQIVSRLDTVKHSKSPSANNEDGGEADEGEEPGFFSGNVASLSRMFAHMNRENIEEKDEGERVRQTVVYQWQQPK